jgi:prepilin-type N-terminal cleavage/methylation domain-containing protein
MKTRGFTLIEMTVVVAIIIVFAALVSPGVTRMMSAQARQGFYGSVEDMIEKTRLDAIRTDTTYAIMVGQGKNELRVVRQPPDTTTQTQPGAVPNPEERPLTNVQSNSDLEDFDSLPLPSPIQTNRLEAGTNMTDPNSFIIHFYPDATCDGGAIEFKEGGLISSVRIDKNGFTDYSRDPIPDPTQQSWPAGTYVSNTST